MVKVWKHQAGDDFTCPNCGAVYAVTLHRFPVRDRDSAKCEECGAVLKEWNSTEVPSFTLKKRKDGSDA